MSQPQNPWGQQNPNWGAPPQAPNPGNAWGQPPAQPPAANPWGQPPAQGNPWGQPPGPPPGANPWGQPPQGNPGGAPNPGPGAAPVLNMNQQTFLTKVFGWMAMGLGLTAVVSALTYITGLWMVLYPMKWLFFIAELGLVWWLSASIHRMQPSTAAGAFLGYSALNGITMSIIFVIYEPLSIALTFLGAASMFGFLFVLGLTVKRDLGPMGRFLAMMTWGLLIVSLFNAIGFATGMLGGGTASMIGLVMSYAGVFIFAGLTAYDAQKLKQMSAGGFQSPADETRMSVLGALVLYLDFINLFLFLLRIFGGRRE
jgi:FtsH-binding integral membrane protein